ncbi:hypothetical protein [Sphingomonas jatrophae]|uniref:Uncharacterized protein n=1 Tax=Sphingomonas jatrophae TaxID=1166337 RepID=A0A1I6KCQ9_9SPHN|nr:hypothetical protein [Sphingomonas jatrophae]SFR88660.1 hypothetical protein SAMN05192580_1547 [Sphingomonas jatrophae]
MSDGTIHSVRLTSTHDGEAALVVELRFGGDRRSMVQLDAEGLRRVMAKAGATSALDLVGRPWTLLDVNETPFVG